MCLYLAHAAGCSAVLLIPHIAHTGTKKQHKYKHKHTKACFWFQELHYDHSCYTNSDLFSQGEIDVARCW